MSLFHRHHTALPPLTVLRGPRNTTPTAVAPPAAPAPDLVTRYEVHYDRVGEHGRDGTLPPLPLTTCATTRREIEAAIAADVRRHLPAGAQVRIIADLGLMIGEIQADGAVAGMFSLRMLGGAR
jgi:hypothetical protein